MVTGWSSTSASRSIAVSANARAARISRTPAAALASFFPHRAFPAADAAASRIAPAAASSASSVAPRPCARESIPPRVTGPRRRSTARPSRRRWKLRRAPPPRPTPRAFDDASIPRRTFGRPDFARRRRRRRGSGSRSRRRVARSAAHARVSAGAPGSRRVTTSTSASAISSRASSISASSPSAAARADPPREVRRRPRVET